MLPGLGTLVGHFAFSVAKKLLGGEASVGSARSGCEAQLELVFCERSLEVPPSVKTPSMRPKIVVVKSHMSE